MKTYNSTDEFVGESLTVGDKVRYRGKKMVVKDVRFTTSKKDNCVVFTDIHLAEYYNPEVKTVVTFATRYKIPT